MRAGELVRDALLELGIVAAEQEITADETQTGIRYANRMFAGVKYLNFERDEIPFEPLQSPSDEVLIPEYAEEWAIKCLALKLRNQFASGDPSGDLYEAERTAKHDMLTNHVKFRPAIYPGTLPVGRANEIWNIGAFYDDYYHKRNPEGGV